MQDVIIIGAGLSGLTTASLLKKEGISFSILEAQTRIGGRIETVFGEQHTPMEMGATWFGSAHQNLLNLLEELGIEYFPQHSEGIALFETMSFEPPQQYFVPANEESAFRINGGTYKLIETLLENVGKETIIQDAAVIQISDEGSYLKVTDQSGRDFLSKKVIIALPPKVAEHQIKFIPSLPIELSEVMKKTQTWMSGSAKFAVEYDQAFWKEKGFSGSVYSQSGLATEIYDHSNAEETTFALKGFLNGSAIHYTQNERKEKVLNQLVHYFGEEARGCISYLDKIWNNQTIQTDDGAFLPPHFNNGHPLYQDAYLDEKLFFSGTETSSLFSGYMEGAVVSGKKTAGTVLKSIRNNQP